MVCNHFSAKSKKLLCVYLYWWLCVGVCVSVSVRVVCFSNLSACKQNIYSIFTDGKHLQIRMHHYRPQHGEDTQAMHTGGLLLRMRERTHKKKKEIRVMKIKYVTANTFTKSNVIIARFHNKLCGI